MTSQLMSDQNMQKQVLSSNHLLAFALMTIMVLGQLYLITHQIEHTLAGEDHSCLVCELADHQADGLTPLLSIASAHLSDRQEVIYHYSYSNVHNSHYLSRAPPTHFSI